MGEAHALFHHFTGRLETGLKIAFGLAGILNRNAFGQQVLEDLDGSKAPVVIVVRKGINHRLASIPFGVFQGVGTELAHTLGDVVHVAVDLERR